MAAYIRKVRTASGATAVQIAAKQGRRDTVLEHLGSAHTDSELAALLEIARTKLLAGQQELDLGLGATSAAPTITGKRSRWLIESIAAAWRHLGFDVVDNEAFFQLVVARLVEPTSVADAGRVLREIGIAPAHRNTFVRTLQRCTADGYRDDIAQRCFAHAATAGDLNLLLYDVTTLYFEADKEDDLRKVGYSKERRVDPQIVVGLLVDRTGFPLEIGCFEGNHASDPHHRAHRAAVPGPPQYRGCGDGHRRRRRDAVGDEPEGSRCGRTEVHRRLEGDEGAGGSGQPFSLERGRVHRRTDHLSP